MTLNLPLRATAAVLLTLVASAALAGETGLAAIHTMRREGGQLCFLDHFHYGSSSGQASERSAKSVAVASWAGFVDLEYGSDWARFSRAHSKSVKCERNGSSWGCMIEARPCR
jgi:hypothetical protein